MYLEKSTFNFLVEVEKKTNTKLVRKFRPREVAQLWRILATFAGDLGSVLLDRLGSSLTPVNPAPVDLTFSSGL